MNDLINELRSIRPSDSGYADLGRRAADEIECLLAKIKNLEEVIKAQSVHIHDDASGSYNGPD